MLESLNCTVCVFERGLAICASLAMPSIFKTSTPLAASAETMFAFRGDPSNLIVDMPPTLRLVSLKTDGSAQEGRMIELHSRDWWILPMCWTCRWKTVRPPELYEDDRQ